MRWKLSFLVLAACLAVSASTYAQPANDPVSKAQGMAMEHYDLGDYALARKKLGEVLAGLTKDGQATSASAATTHVLMGVVFYKESNTDQAKKHYVRALEINAKVTLPKAYSDAGNQAVFAKARLIAYPPKATCDSLSGIAHTKGLGAKQGSPYRIESRIGNTIKAHAVLVMFRLDDTGAFAELPMNKAGECTYAAAIAAAKLTGRSLSYYVVARNKKGKTIARRGNPGSPFVVTIAQVAKAEPVDKTGKPDDDEVPDELRIKKKRGGCAGCGAGESGGAPMGAIMLLAAAMLAIRRRQRS